MCPWCQKWRYRRIWNQWYLIAHALLTAGRQALRTSVFAGRRRKAPLKPTVLYMELLVHVIRRVHCEQNLHLQHGAIVFIIGAVHRYRRGWKRCD